MRTATKRRISGRALMLLLVLPVLLITVVLGRGWLRQDSGAEDWKLRLVNHEHPLPRRFEPELGTTAEGYLFDARAVDALNSMLTAGREAGHNLVLTSAYRSVDYQAQLYENKVDALIAQGYTKSEAETEAATVVARPRESEHNLGLAADIVSAEHNILESSYGDTAEAQWLREHCAEYGFILRYDRGKEPVTGIIYEPWHFRYVGAEAAEYIIAHGLCLEEYLLQLEN